MLKNLKIENFKIKLSKEIWKLRFSDDAKKNFFDNKNISFKDHFNWIKKYHRNQKKIFLIAKHKSIVIGYVRLDYIKNSAKVSTIVKKAYKNKNVASVLLNKAIEKSKKKIIIAEVKKSNLKSINFFLKNKFQIERKRNGIVILMRKQIKKNTQYLKIIKKIENVRKKNNKNWMDILRLAFKNSPDQASKIFSAIYKDDKKISALAKLLTK